MRCHACDKPLSAEESQECFDSCFDCERERHVGQLVHHVKQGRVTLWSVIRALIVERTSGR